MIIVIVVAVIIINNNNNKDGTCRIHLQGQGMSQVTQQHEDLFASCFTLLSCLAYSSTRKMEAIRSSSPLADFQRSTRRYIPGGRILHNYRCENLRSYKHKPIYVGPYMIQIMSESRVTLLSCQH
jgi:hypothetical protein